VKKCDLWVSILQQFVKKLAVYLLLIQHSYRDVTNRADYYYISHQLNSYWLLLLLEVLMIC